ncbi:hypothetical protein BH09BAC5_BH09BAC5_21600 [soil metagenome]
MKTLVMTAAMAMLFLTNANAGIVKRNKQTPKTTASTAQTSPAKPATKKPQHTVAKSGTTTSTTVIAPATTKPAGEKKPIASKAKQNSSATKPATKAPAAKKGAGFGPNHTERAFHQSMKSEMFGKHHKGKHHKGNQQAAK